MVITSEQFKPNQAWTVFTIANLDKAYILIDVYSTFIFGIIETTASGIQSLEIENLFQNAWNTKGEWPETLFIPDSDQSKYLFEIKCLKEGISFKPLPRSDLSDIIETVEKSLADYL